MTSLLDKKIRVVHYHNNKTYFWYIQNKYKITNYSAFIVDLINEENDAIITLSYDEFFDDCAVNADESIREQYVFITNDDVIQVSCEDINEKLKEYSHLKQVDANVVNVEVDEFMLFKLAHVQPKVVTHLELVEE